MYESETWTLTEALEKKIEAFEMWCFRRMERVSWKQRMKNTIVLKKVGTKRQLLAIIKERKLKYFGHIKRSNSIQKFILEGKVKGKRGVGRRRTRLTAT